MNATMNVARILGDHLLGPYILSEVKSTFFPAVRPKILYSYVLPDLL